MAMIQQNISEVKLERMRKKARGRMRIAKGARWGVFGAGALLTLAWSMYGLILMLPAGMSGDALLGLAGMTFGGILLSFLVSLLVYLCLAWALGKTSDEFSQNYKNKYVLMKLGEYAGFFQLKYRPDRSLPAQEICRACLPPLRNPPLLRSMDYWEGSYDCVQFRAAQLDVWPHESHIILFEGQAMIFSLFDDYKISESPVQVFSKGGGKKHQLLTFPQEIQTESLAFHQKFSVYAQDGENAFYILTPRVMEDILEFSQLVETNVYLVFSGQCLYVGCQQAANPFEPQEELPLEAQTGRIHLAAELVKKARDILIHVEEDAKKRRQPSQPSTVR